jgi:hypothetical protein
MVMELLNEKNKQVYLQPLVIDTLCFFHRFADKEFCDYLQY